jgi:hypothetical protein
VRLSPIFGCPRRRRRITKRRRKWLRSSCILVSKYNLKQIKELYKKYNKKFPNIQHLFDRKTKTIKKNGNLLNKDKKI